MKNFHRVFLTSILLASSFTAPSYAQGLLGEGGLVDLSSGEAGDDAVVNVGVGDDDGSGNVLDVDIGSSGDSLFDASVSSGDEEALGVDLNLGEGVAEGDVAIGGEDGLLDGEIDLLDETVNADVNIGDDSLLGLDVDVGGSEGTGGTGGPGSPGGPGGPGGVPPIAGGSGGQVANAGENCAGTSAEQVVKLIQSTRLDASWQRASGVQIQRVAVCPELQARLRAQLAESGIGPRIQSAVASDALISASLGRTNYQPDDVLAVQHSGSQLTVFVY